MSAPLRRYSQPSFECFLVALRDAIRAHGSVTLSEADLGGKLGVTLFDRSAVYLARGLTEEQWRMTLMHELTHLIRGPVAREQADAEEQAVRHETARKLVPSGPALALIDHQWTAEEIERVAAYYRIDQRAVHDAINPPTEPIPIIPAPRADPDPSAVA